MKFELVIPAQEEWQKRTVLCVGRRLLWVFVICFLLATSAHAQLARDPGSDLAGDRIADAGPSLSADRIVRIFREHPDLMDMARRQIESRSTGDNPDLSEAAVYQRLRSDPRMRAEVTQTLIDRGYIETDDPELLAADQANRTRTNALDSADSTSIAIAHGGFEPDGAVASLRPTVPDVPRTPDVPRDRTPRSQQVSRLRPLPSSPAPSVRRSLPPYEGIPALRDLYAQTVDPSAKLERFGIEVFRNLQATGSDSDVPAGPDYVVGPGDSLRIDLWGGVTRRFTLNVDHEGRISLPEVGTILVSGKSLAQTREDIDRALAHEFRNVHSDVSLTRIRTVRVYVVGNVAQPGAYDISALSTVLNAIILAGGPTSEGSLRHIRHLRGDKLLDETDLYDLLLRGVRSQAAHLEPGDTILIPQAERSVWVAGAVKRPAIYELKDEMNLEQVIALAGGVTVSGSLREIRIERIQAHEQRLSISVQVPDQQSADAVANSLRSFAVEDGDRVMIGSIAPYSNASVYLEGHVIHPGKYSYRDGMRITDLINSFQQLMPEPAERAEIVRLVQPDWRPKVLEFDLQDALSGKKNPALQPFDTVRIYSRYAFDPPKVSIQGEVLRVGQYPMSEGMTATDLLRMAGGFKRSAFTETADLVSYSVNGGTKVDLDSREIPIGRAMQGEPDTDVRLKPGDVLTIRQLPGWNDIGASISISGEVRYPGAYGIGPGERLSSVLRRAGGFRDAAYPHGAVLTREQVREIDQQARDALMQRIESANPRIKTPGPETAALSAAFMQQQQAILKRLREQPLSGRQVIRISTDISEWENTAADVEVRPGDQLFIPKRPTFVAIQGQVNSPSAITYIPGKKAEWYLKRAGGQTEFANAKSMFIVRADGSVAGQNNGFWSGGVLDAVMQPGDTLVVPEKIITDNPVWRNLLSTAQLSSSLAIAAKVAVSF